VAEQKCFYQTYHNDGKLSFDDWMYEREMAAIAASKNNNGNGAPVRFCNCPELVINGKRLPCPPYHDCDYVRTRSALVLAANDWEPSLFDRRWSWRWRLCHVHRNL
jgi:hypothetical protein